MIFAQNGQRAYNQFLCFYGESIARTPNMVDLSKLGIST
jgi:hypothetical protein